MNTRNTFLMACAIVATSTLAIELKGASKQKGGNKAPETQNVLTETHWEKVDNPGPKNWLYLSSDAYQAHTAAEKLTMLWDLMVPNSVEDGPQDIQYVEFPELMEHSAGASFKDGDELPRAKDTKSNHSQGVHAKVKWVPVAETIEDLGYTGIYSTGSEQVILRFSETTSLTDTSTGLLPSVAIKFLIDGGASQNLVAMPSFHSSSSWNFFKAPMNTRVPPLDETDDKCLFDTIITHFVATSTTPYATAVGHIAANNTDGSVVETADVMLPWELSFRAPQVIIDKTPDVKSTTENWYDQVKKVASNGETILNVWAKTDPEDDDSWKHIANLDLASDLVTSLFGDQRLYFQHARFGNDKDYWANMDWGRTKKLLELET